MTGLFGNLTAKLSAAALILATFGVTTARAGDDGRYGDRWGRDYRHGDERRYDRDHDHRHDHGDKAKIKVDIDFSGGRYHPRYEHRRVRYWVEPTYRTVTERVWVEPVYKTVYEDVCVPGRYEVRDVVHHHWGRRVIVRERVLVEPACTRKIARNICVSEGHWDVVERKVCVTEGRWDYRVAIAGNVRF
jgi:hypothetical protein